jgi:predicted MPP superfamily phosphohydrolase
LSAFGHARGGGNLGVAPAASPLHIVFVPTSHPARPHGRGRGNRLRFALLVVALAVALQVPLVAALAYLVGHAWAIVALPALLTAAFVLSFVRARSAWATPGPLRLYLVLWPFFTWWTVALLFAVVAPVALAVAALTGVAIDTALVAGLAVAAGAAALSLRQRPRVRTHEVEIDGLPEVFDGCRIAQISDLHCGPFASGRRVAGWVDAVNRLRPDVIAVTGDLIVSGPDFVPVVAAALGGLRAQGGVFAAMGNHDYFGDGEAMVAALERAGLTVLRNRGVVLHRDGAGLFVAGVDDTWTRRDDLERTLADRPAGAPVVLLAHDPVLFPQAAARGVDLVLSGHTHGGQVAIPLFARKLNLARLITPFTNGVYRSGASMLYVNRGLGTTGPPVRIAVAPEIAVLVLRRRAPATPQPEPNATGRLAIDVSPLTSQS